MIQMQHKTKYFIIFAILTISLYVGFSKSGIISASPDAKVGKQNDQLDKLFSKAPNVSKIKINYDTSTLSDFLGEAEIIFKKYPLIIKNSERKSSSYTLIAEVPDSVSEKLYADLRNLPGMVEEKRFSQIVTDPDIDVAEHIKNNQLAKASLLNQLNDKRMYANFYTALHDKINDIQTEIDSLQNIYSIQLHKNKFQLLYLTVNDTVNIKEKNFSSIVVFTKTTILWIAFLSLFGIILYGASIIILKLMRVLGIKTTSESSRYGYGYGSYSYTPKRIKRKYKKLSEDEEIPTDNEEK